jgi:hypothetical protein
MKVELELKETAQTLVIEDVENTYQKGSMYCILRKDNVVVRYPIANIWRIKEYDWDYWRTSKASK